MGCGAEAEDWAAIHHSIKFKLSFISKIQLVSLLSLIYFLFFKN